MEMVVHNHGSVSPRPVAGDGGDRELDTVIRSLDTTMEHLTIQAPAPRLSFLGLPVELRQRTFSFLPAPAVPASSEDRDRAVDPTTAFAILHVSHQIHHEAKSPLYANILVASPWLQHVPVHAAPYIALVSVQCHYRGGRWQCQPALTPVSSRNTWSLENMWRYLGRTFPGVREIRVKARCLDAKLDGSSSGGTAAESTVKRPVVAMPALRCVIVESERDPEDFPGDELACALSLFGILRTEIARLSGGALVVQEQGLW